MHTHSLWLVAGLMVFTFILNLPFGRLRARAKKFSFQWWLYIHLPVPLVIAFRILSHCPYWAIPILIATAVLGQWVGGRGLQKNPK
ncbi:MAG: hypothetical protein HYY14_04085 [Candidatus Omnitrophica bacterium]|nr:hypothetical protein [Candidatus Omnitrophota bacterium]